MLLLPFCTRSVPRGRLNRTNPQSDELFEPCKAGISQVRPMLPQPHPTTNTNTFYTVLSPSLGVLRSSTFQSSRSLRRLHRRASLCGGYLASRCCVGRSTVRPPPGRIHCPWPSGTLAPRKGRTERCSKTLSRSVPDIALRAPCTTLATTATSVCSCVRRR
jgi:hypothetical protein